MDYYSDDLDLSSHRTSRYSRDRSQWRSESDRYSDYDRDLDYPPPPGGAYPPGPPPPLPPDDPLYPRMPPRSLLPHPHRGGGGDFKDPIPDGAIVCGSVVVYPPNPFEPKPKRREKPRVCKTIFVGSIPDNCKEGNLHDIFTQCGNIQEVRVSRGRNFGHVQFTLESSVERAMLLSGCMIKIENSSSLKDSGHIHVDYAQDKAESELKHKVQRNELLSFSVNNANQMMEDLLRVDDELFSYAAKNITSWFGKGACNHETFNTFFDMFGKLNSHSRKVFKNIQEKEEDELEFKIMKKQFYEKLLDESKVLVEVCCTTKVLTT